MLCDARAQIIYYIILCLAFKMLVVKEEEDGEEKYLCTEEEWRQALRGAIAY